MVSREKTLKHHLCHSMYMYLLESFYDYLLLKKRKKTHTHKKKEIQEDTS